MVVGKFLDTVTNLTQKGPKIVHPWCRAKKQFANPEKTEIVTTLYEKEENREGLGTQRRMGA